MGTLRTDTEMGPICAHECMYNYGSPAWVELSEANGPALYSLSPFFSSVQFQHEGTPGPV